MSLKSYLASLPKKEAVKTAIALSGMKGQKAKEQASLKFEAWQCEMEVRKEEEEKEKVEKAGLIHFPRLLPR